MRVVLLIHGLKDAKATGLLRLKEHLEAPGWTVRAVNYGWFFLRGFLWAPFNKPLARMLACFTELLSALGHEVICVAHSNGATIAAEASRLGAPFRVLVFIDGAVERNLRLGDRTGYLLNCRVPSDPVLAVSLLISPLSPWAELDGSLGNFGVKAGSDPRMWDIDLTREFGIHGHGGFLAPTMVSVTGPWLVKSIRWALGETV
jgi:pimeloyl-ACP methyl ester carboxylesterase